MKEDLFSNEPTHAHACDLHMVRADPVQSGCLIRLGAILGWPIRNSQQWAPWQRLRDKFGWPILLKALERCEEQRFPQTIERLCRVELRQREEADRLHKHVTQQEEARKAEDSKRQTNVDIATRYADQLAGLRGAEYFARLAQLRKQEQA